MTINEWAGVLARLRDEDEDRRQALLELSDEDWMRDEDRGWLREAALRSPPLDLDYVTQWNSDTYKWNNDSCRQAVVPDHVFAQLKQPKSGAPPVDKATESYHDHVKGWLDLLQAISREE